MTINLLRLVQFMSEVVLKACNWTLGWILSFFRVGSPLLLVTNVYLYSVTFTQQ